MSALICEVVYRGIFQKNLASRASLEASCCPPARRDAGVSPSGGTGTAPSETVFRPRISPSSPTARKSSSRTWRATSPSTSTSPSASTTRLSKGVESWAWYGLQPINRLTVPNGTVLMTSLQPFDSLLEDIHKKDAPWKLSLIRAKASFAGLWVYREDHTEVRILGALARLAPEFLSLDAVCQAIKEIDWGSDLKVASARKAHDRLETRAVTDHRGQRRGAVLLRDAQVVGDARGRHDPRHSHRQAQGGGKGLRPGAQPVLQEVHDAHHAAGDRLRHLRQVQPLLDLLPGLRAST